MFIASFTYTFITLMSFLIVLFGTLPAVPRSDQPETVSCFLSGDLLSVCKSGQVLIADEAVLASL